MIKGTFASFQELREKYNLNFSFMFPQVRDYVKSHIQDCRTVSPDKHDSCLNKQVDSEKLISTIYNVLENINH